jgi:hypothetical protein
MSDTGSPASTIDAVEDAAAKVREFLGSFEDVDVDEADGSCSLRYGSAVVHVTVGVFDEDQAVVKVTAACVTGAKLSPELFEHVATYHSEVGHLRLVEEEDGTATINFCHSLLGEFLNPAELRMTVVAVAFTADELDDGLAERFGGHVFDADSNKS